MMMKLPNQARAILGLLTIFLLLTSTVTAATLSSTTITPELRPPILKTEYQFEDLGLRQPTSDIISALNKNQLTGLAGGKIDTSIGDVSVYTQQLLLADGDNLQPIAVNYVENWNNNDIIGNHLVVDSGAPFMEWRETFSPALTTRIDRNGNLRHFMGKSLKIMGERWTIFRANFDDPSLTMKLVRNPLHKTLVEGQTQVYLYDGIEYEITNVFVTDPASGSEVGVKFMVNGEVTPTLHEGDTWMYSNGKAMIAVDDIDASVREGQATFYLAGRVAEFSDATLDGNYDGNVEIDNEHLGEAAVSLAATVRGITPTNELESKKVAFPLRILKLESINYRLTMDSDQGYLVFIQEGSSISEHMQHPEAMLSGSWDLTLHDMAIAEPDDFVKLEAFGDDTYKMEFTNIYGETYQFPILSNELGYMRWGDDDDDFVFSEPSRVANGMNGTRYWYEDVILLNKGTERAIRYVNHNTAERTIDFRIGGVVHAVAYTGTPGVDAFGTLVVDGLSYDVRVYEGNEITVSDSHLSGTIRDDSYFLVSPEPYSAVFRYEDIDMNDRTIELKNMATGATLTVPYQGEPGAGASGSFVSGGQSFDFWVHYDGSLTIDLNGDGYLNTLIMRAVTRNGGILYLTHSGWEPMTSEMMTLLVDVDAPNNLWEQYHWRIEARPNNEIDLVAGRNYEGPFAGGEVWNEFDLHEDATNEDFRYAMTDYGVLIENYAPSAFSLATSVGTEKSLCGNGILEPGEACDGTDWGPVTSCADFGGFVGGTLVCTAQCMFDTSGCVSAADPAELVLSIPHQRLKPNLVVTMSPFRFVPTPVFEPAKTLAR